MKFSDSANKTGIVEDIDFMCGSDATSFPLADKARLANFYLYKAVTTILRCNRDWEFDDSNHTTVPYVTTTLVANQQDYSLPSDMLKFQGVSVKDSAGNYKPLKRVERKDMRVDPTEYQETAGMPTEYDIVGSSIYLYPKPSATEVTTSAGLKIFFSREVDVFTASDTTQEPGIPEPFHRICSFGPSYEYLLDNGDKEKAIAKLQQLNELLADLLIFYSDRNEEAKTQIRPAHRTMDYL